MKGEQFDTFLFLEKESLSPSVLPQATEKFKPYTNVCVHTYRDRHNKSGNKLCRLKLSLKKKLDGKIIKEKNQFGKNSISVLGAK